MFFNTKKMFFALSLMASPLVILSGCGGGNGLSPTPTTTPEPTVTPLPTGTGTPTPTSTSFASSSQISATFFNSTVRNVGTGFQTNQAQGFFSTGNDGEYTSQFTVSFRREETNYREMNLVVRREPGKNVKQGDVLQLSDDSSSASQTFLAFSDTTNNLSFYATSGQVRLDTIRKIDNVRYMVKFTIINARMISRSTSSSKGQFTLNATATVTIDS